MIAFVEARNDGEAIKNELCVPVSMGDTVADYVPLILGNMAAQLCRVVVSIRIIFTHDVWSANFIALLIANQA